MVGRKPSRIPAIMKLKGKEDSHDYRSNRIWGAGSNSTGNHRLPQEAEDCLTGTGGADGHLC